MEGYFGAAQRSIGRLFLFFKYGSAVDSRNPYSIFLRATSFFFYDRGGVGGVMQNFSIKEFFSPDIIDERGDGAEDVRSSVLKDPSEGVCSMDHT